MAEPFWNRHDEEDRQRFARLLAPLVGASRTKSFTRHEGTAYMLSLGDVPPDVLEAAVVQLVRQGMTWMPKPGELKATCAAVMAEKREQAFRAALPDRCDVCGHEKAHTGARWKEVSINGVMRLTACDCRVLALKAAERVGLPIGLPAARDDERDSQPEYQP